MTSLIINSRLLYLKLLLTKATAMECKCKENKDVKKLEGVLKLLEQKRKVEVEYN